MSATSASTATSTSLGRYCLQLDNGSYYNTIEHRQIGQEDLRKELMLAGQEREAIINRVLRLGKAQVTLIPSFECNLRCPHCYVGHMLKKPTGNKQGDNLAGTLDLLDRIDAHPGWGLGKVAFVGGEPLLHPDYIRAVLDHVEVDCSITTNGMWDFDEVRDILGHPRLPVITFSIDGVPEHHDKIRRALNHEPSTFKIAYGNLARTVREFKDKIVQVQGCCVGRVYSHEEHRRYRTLMALAGLRQKWVKLSYENPSPIKSTPTPQYLEASSKWTRMMPCCDYRLGTQIVVNGTSIYGSYFTMASEPPLGSLDDDLDEIIERQKKRILSSMPLLADPVCIGECKAVGVCWGLCSNNNDTYGDRKPSSRCDRGHKEANLLQLSMKGPKERRHTAGEIGEQNNDH